MFLHRKRIKICKFICPCDLCKIRGNVKPFQTLFEHQDDKSIPVQAFEIFPHGVNIKSEITKNVSGKIPVFRILFNIPTIFFDVLRGIVGVCVLLTPRNDIIGSSVVIFSTDTLVQVIQRKPELISVQAVSTVEFRNIALAQTGGDYDFSILFCFFIEDRNAPKVEKSIDGYSGFLFYDDNGMPLVAMHWQHRFNHMVGRYNDIYRVQMPNITPHVCRHTYCSNMAKSGMNPKTLQYLMGHSDISVTMNVYTHIGFDDAEEELKRMEEFRKAQAEVEQKKEKPMSQKMFKVV